MDAHVLVQVVTAAELPFAPPDGTHPRYRFKSQSLACSRKVSLTFIVGVNGPDVPFEVLTPDETLAAAIDVAGICSGAFLRLVFAARIDGFP